MAQASSSAGPVGSADEDAAPAGRVARALRVVGAGDRNLIDRRRLARVPVQVVVRLVRLPLGFEQRRRVLARTSRRDRAARPSPRCGPSASRPPSRCTFVVGGRLDGERRQALAVQQHLQFVRLAEALDLLVAVPRQPDLDVVLAVLREGVRDQDAAARPQGQPVDVSFLRQVRPDAEGVAVGERRRPADRQPADLLRRRDVAVQQRRRQVAQR